MIRRGSDSEGKSFDCVAFKRKAQERIYRRIRGLSVQGQMDFFRRQAEEGALGGWWMECKAAARKASRRGPSRPR